MITNYMTKDIITVKEDDSLASLLKVMVGHRLSGIPVVDNGGVLVGFVPTSRILQKMLPDMPRFFFPLDDASQVMGQAHATKMLDEYLREQKSGLKDVLVRDIMIEPSYKLNQSSSFMEVIKAFVDKGINRIAVVDDQGRIVGIVCRNNILSAVYDSFKLEN